MKIPTFPGKYHQNGGFSWAMLVYKRVNFVIPRSLKVSHWLSQLPLTLSIRSISTTPPLQKHPVSLNTQVAEKAPCVGASSKAAPPWKKPNDGTTGLRGEVTILKDYRAPKGKDRLKKPWFFRGYVKPSGVYEDSTGMFRVLYGTVCLINLKGRNSLYL